jgi:deoxyadenosine/deoxycytidine kinase
VWLSRALKARLIREDYAGNPFLEEAWLGRADLALPAQLYFLFSRVGQLSLATWPADGVAVSDYGFCQDAVYARRSLSGQDLVIYRRLAQPAGQLVKPPEALVHLDADETLLLERIRQRGRRHETAFDAPFLAEMRRAYRQVAQTARCPVLTIDTGAVNLLQEPGRAGLLAAVRSALDGTTTAGKRQTR